MVSELLAAIKRCEDHYGENVAAGNCGMFALALCEFLKQQGKAPMMAFIYRDPADETKTIKDVLALETDIYHVVVMFEGKLYDGHGETTADNLLDMAERQYGDGEPAYMTEVAPHDMDMLRLIENDTDWSITSQEFLAILRG
jgi:hypothetical protein